jgi:hypothetical protein
MPWDVEPWRYQLGVKRINARLMAVMTFALQFTQVTTHAYALGDASVEVLKNHIQASYAFGIPQHWFQERRKHRLAGKRLQPLLDSSGR